MQIKLVSAPDFSHRTHRLIGADRTRFTHAAQRYESVVNHVVGHTHDPAEATKLLMPLFDDAARQGNLKADLMAFLADAMKIARTGEATATSQVLARFEVAARGDYSGMHATFSTDAKATSATQTQRSSSLSWNAVEATPLKSEPIEGKPVIQGFHWGSAGRREHSWWSVVKENAQRIADAGFKAIWLPPASASADIHGYLPHRWHDFNSGYGTESEHATAVSELNRSGVLPIADVVANHRVGVKNWADFEAPPLPADAVAGNDEWPGARGAQDTGAGFHAGRDLDHQNPKVQAAVSEWVQKLLQLGYGGLRWDYTKGFAADAVRGYLVAAQPSAHQPQLPSVGELWEDLDIDHPDAHRQRIVDWIDGTGGKSGAFDFTTKGLLQHALATGELWRLRDEHGKPAGVLGHWPERAWTFLDNHDTGQMPAGQGHWPFPADKVAQGYAYLLTHPGTPMVFWPHYFDWGDGLRDTLRTAMALREEMGIQAGSKVDIEAAQPGLYAAITHGTHGSLAVKIGKHDWQPGPGWTLGVSGHEFAIWKKAAP